MKTWKQNGMAFIAIIALAFALITCDDKNNNPVLCTCPTGTTHEPNQKCCEGTDCNCPIAEPAVRTFNDLIIFTDWGEGYIGTEYFVDIYDARTACGSKTLEQLGVVQQLRDATEMAFESAFYAMGAIRSRFRYVFNPLRNIGGKVKITIENNVNYESYEVDDSANVRFNIAYLTSVSDDDLQTAITTAVPEMYDKVE